MKTAAAIALATALLAASPPVASSEDAGEQAVVAVVQGFFDALAERDVKAAAGLLASEGQFVSLREADGSLQQRREAFSDFLENLGSGREQFLERLWNPEVRIQGPIASLWTRYDFHRDGVFSHCGVDAVHLLRDGDEWKIAGVLYTVERAGCPESPLGAPVEDR